MNALAAILQDDDYAGADMSPAIVRNFPRLGSLRQQLPDNLSNPNHLPQSLHVVSSVPRLHHQDDAESETMRPETNLVKSGSYQDRIPSRDEVRDAIKTAFAKILPQYRVTAQEIADKIGAKDATVEGWRTKPGLMSAEYLVMLMIAFPDFGTEVRKRLRLQPELAPQLRSIMDDVEERIRATLTQGII